MTAGLAGLAEAMQHTAQFSFNLAFVVNRLPLWFLVFALFLPRIAMAVAWSQGVLLPFHLDGIIPPLFWLFLPRILVLSLFCGGGPGVGWRRSPDATKEPARLLVQNLPQVTVSWRRVILRRYGTTQGWHSWRDRYGRAAIHSVVGQSSVV